MPGKLFPFVFVVLSFTAFSQKVPLIHSGEAIEKGKILYDSGKYAEALKEFSRVPERDTNYVLMLTEAALTHMAAEQYDEVLERCRKGLSRPTEYAPYFLRYQAIAEDKKGNFELSVKIFQDAIKKYPTDYGLLYNLGVTYYNNGQHEKAVDIFFQVLAINPFHAGSHLNLGRISIGQGRKVHGILSMGLYLSISNADNARLVLLNNFVDNQVAEEGTIGAFGLNEAEKLDQIIRAKIAMDKNFKSEIAMDAPVVRQVEMLFQQLNTIGANPEDPWVKTYLPVYTMIREKNLTEPFIYYILSSSPNQHVKKWLSKNEKTLNAFYESVNTALKKQREMVSLANVGFSKPIQAWYNGDNIITALGENTPEGIRKGHWKLYHTNYQLSAEGDYSDQGKKTGIWKYYNNDGTLKTVENHATGEVLIYYPDGTKRQHFYLKDDAISGEVELYYPCGPLREKLLYQNDNRHGKGNSYYPTGQVTMTYEYANDKAVGEFKTYFADGTLKAVENYTDDELSGDYRSYHPNGKLEAQGRYLNGQTIGEWTHYHSNGKVARKGAYTSEGLVFGEWVYFDESGNVIEKRQFDDGGRLNGANPHYAENKLHYTDTYKKDVLIESVFYDGRGKEIARAGNGDGNFAVRGYFPTGQLQSEGSYRKGKNHGVWKTYNRFGKVISEYNYVNGLLQGKAVEYYSTGEKRYDVSYKDNQLHGYFLEYYRHGRVKQEGWFQDGNREQQWLTYFADGTLETDSYYLLNSLTGPYYTYSQDGKLYSVATYEDGRLADIENFDRKGILQTVEKLTNHTQTYEETFANKKLKARFDLLCGDYVNDLTKWYPDGTIYYSYQFLNGKKQGRYIYNEVGGKLAMEGVFRNDVEEGTWKSYYHNGQVSNEGRYVNGLKDSVWNYYFDDGKISSTITYQKDEHHGLTRYYSPEGTPLLEKIYAHGDLLAWRLINENEESSAWIDFTGTATISVKNSGGQVVFEETYTDGVRHGYQRLYFSNGKLHKEYHYDRGDLHGPFVLYHPNGKVKERGAFEYDEMNGKMEAFNADGTPRVVENYRMGSRDGSVKYFTKAGAREYSFWDGIIE